MEYRVIRTCYWKNTYYTKGEMVELPDDVTPPEHFELALSTAQKLANRKAPVNRRKKTD